MFIALDPKVMRNANDYDDVLWAACSELHHQGVANFIHKTEPRTVTLTGQGRKLVPVIDFARSGVRFYDEG